MANFRIKVEALNPDVEVNKELLEGLECDGYFLVGHNMLVEDTSMDVVAISKVSKVDMAFAIAKSPELLEAAMIARGIEEGRLMRKHREKPKASDLLAAMLKQ